MQGPEEPLLDMHIFCDNPWIKPTLPLSWILSLHRNRFRIQALRHEMGRRQSLDGEAESWAHLPLAPQDLAQT